MKTIKTYANRFSALADMEELANQFILPWMFDSNGLACQVYLNGTTYRMEVIHDLDARNWKLTGYLPGWYKKQKLV